MADSVANPSDAEVNREIQRFSMQALELAKSVVDGSATDEEKQTARALSERLPELAAKAGALADDYRVGAARTLADARLDLAYVAADGAVPSSTRLGWYIKEKGADQGR